MNPAELARYEKGLTIAEAADQSGVHERTIRRVEAGSKPTATTAKQLADFYGITVARLLGVDVDDVSESGSASGAAA